MHIRRIRDQRTALLLGLLAVLGVAGCGSIEPVAPFEQVTDPARLYARLALNYRAINLSTAPGYSTVQLTATPLNALGEPIPGLPAPTFRSSDTTTVRVTPDGLVEARGAITGVSVIAELAGAGNVRHADTALVNVNETTDPPPVLATFSIEPADSAMVPMAGKVGDIAVFIWTSALGVASQNLLSNHQRALTAAGDPIPNLIADYTSLDPTIATLDPINRAMGQINGLRPGSVGLVARTFAYGVSMEATATFTITPPVFQTFVMEEDFTSFGPTLVIRPNGLVFWVNRRKSIDVEFDDPAAAARPADVLCDAITNNPFFPAVDACGSGNFTQPFTPPTYSSSARVRQFPNAGTYTFHDTQTNAVGQVIVTDGTTP